MKTIQHRATKSKTRTVAVQLAFTEAVQLVADVLELMMLTKRIAATEPGRSV